MIIKSNKAITLIEIFSPMQIQAIALGLFIVAREDSNIRTMNHERIHLAQWRETFYIGFILIYVLEYLFYLATLKDHYLAYRSVCFEQEAFENENDLTYLITRKNYCWI